MDLRDVFAANLRRLRHEKGLSQDDLAYEAEVSRSYLSQLEKGAFYASLKIIGRLAEALGVEPAELLRRGTDAGERGSAVGSSLVFVGPLPGRAEPVHHALLWCQHCVAWRRRTADPLCARRTNLSGYDDGRA
jgi:transcriptional regulator with XRE-family HTH domain